MREQWIAGSIDKLIPKDDRNGSELREELLKLKNNIQASNPRIFLCSAALTRVHQPLKSCDEIASELLGLKPTKKKSDLLKELCKKLKS